MRVVEGKLEETLQEKNVGDITEQACDQDDPKFNRASSQNYLHVDGMQAA